MTFCHITFLPYMPAGWQNLAQVDASIIDEYEKDTTSRRVFMCWLNSLKTQQLKDFVDRHPSLCRGVMRILPCGEKREYYWLVQRVNNLVFGKSGSNPFWIESERFALPPSWQGHVQESRLIELVTNNENVFARMLEGIRKTSSLIMYDYPRVGLAVVEKALKLYPADQKLKEVQNTARAILQKRQD